MGSEGGLRTHIFIASNCSFFGIISSIYGASNGYVVTNCVLRARCTEDLTLDLEPGLRLLLSAGIPLPKTPLFVSQVAYE